MVLEEFPAPFNEWIATATGHWLGTMAIGVVLALLVSYLILAVIHGPIAGWVELWGRIRGVISDWRQTSPRRLWALATLAMRESIRRRVVITLVVFAVGLLFAGLFLDPSGDRSDRLYLELVLSSTTYLMIVLAMVLSTFSLPNDIRDRTIFTIVSKPVRSHEIILGRIAGFTATGTVMLLVMGVLSYLFVVRGLSHTHQLTEDDLQAVKALPGDKNPVVFKGETPRAHGHRHQIEVYKDGTVLVDDGPGHWHQVTTTEVGGKKVFNFSAPVGQLKARVPVYGKLRFLDRDGKPVDKGINVGKEWTYRSCIEGRSGCAAIWTFEGLTPEQFPDGLPFELTQGVFRTWKSDIERGIPGSITLRNPVTKKESNPRNFVAREYYVQQIMFPRTVDTPGGKQDLFKYLIEDGKLEVEIRCKEHAQYYCLAGPDLYLRATNAPFELNFIKGYWGIWLQLLLVTSVGVCASTFLRGPVALLATIGVTSAGFFSDFMKSLYTGTLPGGGPTEAAYRIVQSMNPVIDLPDNMATQSLMYLDKALNGLLFAFQAATPDFLAYNDTGYVSNGFDISNLLLLRHTISALAYIVPVLIIGHFCLKYRQVAE